MIPQFVPYWGEDEVRAVADVLENSDYLNEHKTVRAFERGFAEHVGAKHCVTVTSGTVALYCAINAVYRREKRVAVPTHDGIFAFNALTASGISPVVVDVDRQGLIDTVEDEAIAVARQRTAGTRCAGYRGLCTGNRASHAWKGKHIQLCVN